MKNYERPIVLANSDLSEGVYAASGSGPLEGTYSLNLIGETSSTKEYNISITNTSSERVDNVTVTVTVFGDVSDIYGSNLKCALNGNGTATITCDNYGWGFNANATSALVQVYVEGSGNFGIR